MDPATLMMLIGGGSSLLGGLFGGPEQQERKPYGGAAGAQRSLEGLFQAISSMGSTLENRGPARLRAMVPQPPKPVSVPGLGFQIGGGLGMDPAQGNPSYLAGRDTQPSAFAGLQAGMGSARGAAPNTGGTTSGRAQMRKPESF